jgi:hypothetical protein
MNLKSTAWNILKGKIEREIENLSKARLEKSETLFWSRPIIYPEKMLLNFIKFRCLVSCTGGINRNKKKTGKHSPAMYNELLECMSLHVKLQL